MRRNWHFHFGGLGEAIMFCVLIIAVSRCDAEIEDRKLEWAKFCSANPTLKHEKCKP